MDVFTNWLIVANKIAQLVFWQLLTVTVSRQALFAALHHAGPFGSLPNTIILANNRNLALKANLLIYKGL